MIRLEDINPDNWRLSLHVSDEQKTFVANSTVMPARAYAYRESRSRAFVIYNDETPVGMALYYDMEDAYNFSQFFIDERYQGRGLGYKAAEMIFMKWRKTEFITKWYSAMSTETKRQSGCILSSAFITREKPKRTKS